MEQLDQSLRLKGFNLRAVLPERFDVYGHVSSMPEREYFLGIDSIDHRRIEGPGCLENQRRMPGNSIETHHGGMQNTLRQRKLKLNDFRWAGGTIASSRRT